MDEKKLLNTEETMAILGRKRKSLYLYRHQGKLTPLHNRLGHVAYDETEVRQLMAFLPAKRGGRHEPV